MRLAIVIALCLAQSGCSSGLGVGAATPEVESHVVEEVATHAEIGDSVRLVMKDGSQMSGAVGASDEKVLEIQQPGSRSFVRIDDIRSMRKLVLERTRSNKAIIIALLVELSIAALVGTVALTVAELSGSQIRF